MTVLFVFCPTFHFSSGFGVVWFRLILCKLWLEDEAKTKPKLSFTRRPIHLISIHSSIHSSVHSSIHSTIHPSIQPSIHLTHITRRLILTFVIHQPSQSTLRVTVTLTADIFFQAALSLLLLPSASRSSSILLLPFPFLASAFPSSSLPRSAPSHTHPPTQVELLC